MLYLDVLAPGMQVPHTTALTFWTCKCSRQCTRASRPAPECHCPDADAATAAAAIDVTTDVPAARVRSRARNYRRTRYKVSTNSYMSRNSNVTIQ